MKIWEMWRQLPNDGELIQYLDDLTSLEAPPRNLYKALYEELTIIDGKTSGKLAYSSLLAILYFQIYQDLLEGSQPYAEVGVMFSAGGLVLEVVALLTVIWAIMATWVPHRGFLDAGLRSGEKDQASDEARESGSPKKGANLGDQYVREINLRLLKERCWRTRCYAWSWLASLISVVVLAGIVSCYYVYPTVVGLRG